MHTNIIPFPKTYTRGRPPIIDKVRDNIIQFDEWRTRARVRRTRNSVYFVSNVVCFSGDAA